MRRILKVMITCRDRPILTRKCIESLHQNTKLFDRIDVYCFDNLSTLSGNRFSIFEDMIKKKEICFYSYDTPISTTQCFGKSIAYKRWLDMMNTEERVLKSYDCKDEFYYLLIDNDMIICERWDEYFITSLQAAKSTTFFLVKYPGGLTRSRNLETRMTLENKFQKNDRFEIVNGLGGGGSGFWFMNSDMIKKHIKRWTPIEVAKTYKIFKKHDSTMWESIAKVLRGRATSYLIRVVSPNDNYPLVLHLGPVVGSMCKSLMSKNYIHEKHTFDATELELKDMSVDEIIEKFNKDKCRRW